MSKLNKTIEDMFATDQGNNIYERITETIKNEHMSMLIDSGLLVGFSGGADSVFLLSFLVEYQRRTSKTFPVLAVHINHCIRGDEAERDERFSREITNNLGIEFLSFKIDVPAMSEKLGIGLEEAARNARYSIFSDLIRSRNDIKTIVTAHNATDNTETVLLNSLRGSGLSGVCGIKPVRDNIVRPIIAIAKTEITSLLAEFDIPYVVDSTNLLNDYSRNYVRNLILPMFSRLSEDPVAAFTRLTEILRTDLDYINSQADAFINDKCNDGIFAEDLRSLHPSLFAKVISKIVFSNTGAYPEEKHVSSLRSLINSDNFRYALPGEKFFVCERGTCRFVAKKCENKLAGQIFSLSKGENKISGTNLTVFIGEIDKSSLNVYKFSIQASISSAIIDKGLTLRFKKNGDAYRYSGMTHKLKKVFNDRNIPVTQRDLIPIICDEEGIVVLPGMSARDGVRNDISSMNIQVTFAYAAVKDGETELFTALSRK